MGYFKGFSRRDYIQKVHELIRREGVDAISIRRIAREMGCSSASLYRHFESLTELLYYAELRNLTAYILRLNEGEKKWKNLDSHKKAQRNREAERKVKKGIQPAQWHGLQLLKSVNI